MEVLSDLPKVSYLVMVVYTKTLMFDIPERILSNACNMLHGSEGKVTVLHQCIRGCGVQVKSLHERAG